MRHLLDFKDINIVGIYIAYLIYTEKTNYIDNILTMGGM